MDLNDAMHFSEEAEEMHAGALDYEVRGVPLETYRSSPLYREALQIRNQKQNKKTVKSRHVKTGNQNNESKRSTNRQGQ
jgi:hypothetical protein